jgi:hypothetical protein
LRDRVHRDRELDVAAELLGEGLGDQGAQPGFQLFLDELVRGGNQGSVLDQPQRTSELEPRSLVRLDLKISQTVEGSCPYICQVRIRHLCSPRLPMP